MVGKLICFLGVMFVAIWLPLNFSSQLAPAPALLLKLACAALFTYATLEVAALALRLIHLLFGVDPGPLQRDPILSRTLAEFWGERWNLPVGRWLNQHFFRPLARKGHPIAGIAAAFIASAVLHFWLFFAAIDWQQGALAALFFLLQLSALLLERRWRVRRWPTPLARLWTIAFVLVSSALLTLPMILGLEMQLAALTK